MKRLRKIKTNVKFQRSKMTFDIYALEDFDFTENLDLGQEVGVYLFSKRIANGDTFHHHIYYCGQTKHSSRRFYQHHKSEKLEKENPNCISFHTCKETQLDDIEKKLIELYNPKYNIALADHEDVD